MRKTVCLFVFALLCAAAADHPDLGGTWVLDASHSDTHDPKLKAETLNIDQQPENIKLSESITLDGGKETTSLIACNTAGQSCKIKDHGAADVSFWYNGAMLVMSEVRGQDSIVKRRLKPSEDGHTLTMEIIHLAPVEKTETLTFNRSQDAKAGGF